MGPFGPRCERAPLTNRGVELAEACFRRSQNTERGPHNSRICGPLGPWVGLTYELQPLPTFEVEVRDDVGFFEVLQATDPA